MSFLEGHANTLVRPMWKDDETIQLFPLKDEDPKEVFLAFAKFLGIVKEMKECYDVV
jgi:hypothetical protein